MGGPAAIPGHPWKGQDGPCSPRSCARADSTSSPGGGAGRTSRVEPKPRLRVRADLGLCSPSGIPRAWEQRKGTPLEERERLRSGNPPAASGESSADKAPLAAEIRTLSKVTRVSLSTVW